MDKTCYNSKIEFKADVACFKVSFYNKSGSNDIYVDIIFFVGICDQWKLGSLGHSWCNVQ